MLTLFGSGSGHELTRHNRFLSEILVYNGHTLARLVGKSNKEIGNLLKQLAFPLKNWYCVKKSYERDDRRE